MDITLGQYLILFTLLFTFIIQVVYYLFIYRKVGCIKLSSRKGSTPPVSVIICARDEALNLERNLPQILQQDYPDYEVIVVNDASTDHSEEILKHYSGKFPHLRYTTIRKDEKFTHGKKLAVLVGIKAAKSEYLLFTDADCTPVSKKWIRKMARNFTRKTTFILGYGGIKTKPGLLNNYVRYDTFFIALQYLGFALSGKPYMGVGRNMAYRKTAFFENKGFGQHASLLSGDDDLIVNAMATGKNTHVETDPEARTLTEPPHTWREWFRKKRRHITTGGHYRTGSLLMTGGELISRILFYFSILACILFISTLPFSGRIIAGGALALRWVIMLVVFHRSGKRLQEKQLLLSSLLYDILSPFLYLGIWMSNLFSTKPVIWK
ncbi:MAG: glycosyltransferase [Chlorobi bacterium]|nr:glycosyltransferase [Chlorobiota bacterium]